LALRVLYRFEAMLRSFSQRCLTLVIVTINLDAFVQLSLYAVSLNLSPFLIVQVVCEPGAGNVIETLFLNPETARLLYVYAVNM
jgi:hypothetical protein